MAFALASCWLQVFALHPLYLSLKATLRESTPEIEAAICAAQQKLEALPSVDYVETKSCKLDIARRIFELQGEHDLQVHLPGWPTELTFETLWMAGDRGHTYMFCIDHGCT